MKKYLVKVTNSTISKVNPYGFEITVFEKEADTIEEAQSMYSLYEKMIKAIAEATPEIKSDRTDKSYKGKALIEEYDPEDEEDEGFEIKSISIAIGCVCVGGLVEHEDGLYIKTWISETNYSEWSKNHTRR